LSKTIKNNSPGRYNTDDFNNSLALLFDFSLAIGTADNRNTKDNINTPDK
jgi:hypothetical protein